MDRPDGPEVDIAESPIIIRPEDPELLERLERKRLEYRERLKELGEYTHPEQLAIQGLAAGSSAALDNLLKLSLLEAVLNGDGVVNTWEFTNRLVADGSLWRSVAKTFPDEFAKATENACGVIQAYCQDRASEVTGGTGLN